MSNEEILLEARRREDRRAQGLPLSEIEPSDADTLERIAETDNRLEKEIQAQVMKLYRAFGCVVYNLSQARASKQSPGLPDLYVVHRGIHQAWWHETKTPFGKQSVAQKYFGEIHTKTPIRYVLGGVRAAEEQMITLAIAVRGPDGYLEGIR